MSSTIHFMKGRHAEAMVPQPIAAARIGLRLAIAASLLAFGLRASVGKPQGVVQAGDGTAQRTIVASIPQTHSYSSR